MDQDETFPLVSFAEGSIARDGLALLLKFNTVESGEVRLSLKKTDIESLTILLLQLASYMGRPSETKSRGAYQPISISEVSAGEFEDGNGLLGVTVGPVDLVFQMPGEAISDIARTLLAASVPKNTKRMS